MFSLNYSKYNTDNAPSHAYCMFMTDHKLWTFVADHQLLSGLMKNGVCRAAPGLAKSAKYVFTVNIILLMDTKKSLDSDFNIYIYKKGL